MRKKPAIVCKFSGVSGYAINYEKVMGQLPNLTPYSVRSNDISRHCFFAVGERESLVCWSS